MQPVLIAFLTTIQLKASKQAKKASKVISFLTYGKTLSLVLNIELMVIHYYYYYTTEVYGTILSVTL